MASWETVRPFFIQESTMDDLEKVQAQIAELQRKADELLHQKKAAVIEDVKAKIKAYGLTAKDLGFVGKSSSKAGTTVAIKYRYGEHSWTGRGRQPKFVVDYIAAGGKLEELEI